MEEKRTLTYSNQEPEDSAGWRVVNGLAANLREEGISKIYKIYIYLVYT